MCVYIWVDLMKMKNELGWRTRPSSSTKDHVPAVQTDLAVLPHEHAQFRPYSPESTNNAETTRVWGMWERAHQYNLPHENVRQTEMSLKDNSGLRYRGKKMVSKPNNDRPLWSGPSVGNSTLFSTPETLTPPCVWSKSLLCEGALIKTTAIIVLGAKHLKLITKHNSGGFLATFLIIFPLLLR